jgi:flagellar biosynthesis activator protein FlaF
VQKKGLGAYQKVIETTLSGRELEAAILTKAANKLKACQDRWGDEGHFKRLDEALTYNQRVWTIFQDELARANNPMPEALRADILRLSIVIDKRIVEVMNDPSPGKLDIIININRNLAAGLRGSPA